MSKNKIPIIGIGLSTNGSESLPLYFNQVADQSGYAYVIIQDSSSDLKSIIDKLSDLKFLVKIIEDGTKLQKDTIYITPAYRSVALSSNTFQLKEIDHNTDFSYLISTFFQSVVKEKIEGSAILLLPEIDYLAKSETNITQPLKNLFSENGFHKLSSVASQTKTSVIITDIEGRIDYVNESFLKLTGFDEDFVMGKRPGEFLQGEDTDPKTVEIMGKAIATKQGFEVEVVNYNKSGRKYWTNIICEPLLDEKNSIKGFFSIQYEISQKKEYQDQVNSLNELLKSRNNKLTELNKSLEEFAYVASHDLKEPARNIKSILDLIIRKSDNALDETLMKYMQMAASAGEKMNQMINSLLEYSRSGVLDEELETVRIDEIVNEVKFSLQSLIKEHGVKIEIKDKIGSFNAYPILFGRLLQNLIQNAIKYRSEENPKITIKTTENELHYLFSVIDYGIGISQRNFDRIFKIFQKVHNNDKDSHGIGLAICKKIVETHLGEITVESQEGYGSTFHFSISKQLQ